MWFLFALAGYFLLAIASVLDKFILSKSLGSPVVYTFYSTIFLLLAFAAVPFGAPAPMGLDLFYAFVVGFLFALGLLTFFIALKHGETSHMSPFVGGVVTIATYVLSNLLLGETLTSHQAGGVMILSFATFLLSFEKSKKYDGFHTGFLWGILAGVVFALSHVGVKHLYDNYSFLTGLVWSRGTAGFFGMGLLLVPAVRESFRRKHRQMPLKSYARRHAFGIVVANKVLGTVGLIVAHYAIAMGSVTIVNALAGLEYVFLFTIVFICTKFFPKLFKEYFTRRELAVEVVAIVLAAVGSLLFVV